eukprot:CAMPEP_0179301830 /NCGR_PEP_ID=MMETSP0797-20121207/47752_1 /TAXON_ID=47934 /ORGANISM="Dinophysis acuminata, Strain DAEP01" /LENGTH=308 /DNA_ID=CAMNT_0021011343 /DNA_START=91 /DNA_END=1014 /DNA_ORIENTATION=+
MAGAWDAPPVRPSPAAGSILGAEGQAPGSAGTSQASPDGLRLLEERERRLHEGLRRLHEGGRDHEALPELVVADPPAAPELEDLEAQAPVALVALPQRGARGGVEGRAGAGVDEVAPVAGGVARRPEALHVLDQDPVALLPLDHPRLRHFALPTLRLQSHRDYLMGLRDRSCSGNKPSKFLASRLVTLCTRTSHISGLLWRVSPRGECNAAGKLQPERRRCPCDRVNEVAPVSSCVARIPEVLHLLHEDFVAVLPLGHHRRGHRALPALRLQRQRDDHVGLLKQVVIWEQAVEVLREPPGHWAHLDFT